MAKTKTISLSILLAICFSAIGQEPEQQLNAFAGTFINSLRSQSKPNAFLITDKQVYVPGEAIWFKASLIDPDMLQPDPRTHFLFVDLVNEKDSVIDIAILDAQAHQLNARMFLSDSIRSGYYWMRAYTRTMAEKNAENISLTPIVIIGKEPMPPGIPAKPSPVTDSILISFYPEGGSIMPGEESIVGVKATDGNGRPIVIDGLIKDNRDTTITHFSTNIHGLGKFELNASGFRRYRALVSRQGKSKAFSLPPFNFQKGQLSVTKASGGYAIRALLGDSIYAKDALSYILVVSKDSLIFASIGRGQYEMLLKDQQVTGGICTFYLLDKDFKLLCQRSIYVPEKTNLLLKTDREVYSAREKVTGTFGITDGAGQPLTALVSIIVADSTLQQLRPPCGNPILPRELTNMMLANNACLSDSVIDLFMLTRPQDFFITTSGQDNLVADMDSLLYIKGKVVNEKDEPQAQAIVTLRSGTGQLLSNPDTTNARGFFRFPVESYADSTQFLLHVEGNKSKNNKNRLILEEPSFPKLITPKWMKESFRVSIPSRLAIANMRADSIMLSNDKQMLSKATVRGRKKPTNYDESKRISSSSVVLTSEILNERTTVGAAVLNNAGLQLLQGFLVIDGPSGLAGPDKSSEPMIVVNGVTVTPPDDMRGASPVLSYLNTIQPQDVEFVEILRGPEAATFGLRGARGVISVNLSNRRKGPDDELLNLKVFHAKGIARFSPFPDVSYDSKAMKNRTGNDARSTLYWNSELLTGVTAEKPFAFFASDRPGTYQIIVKGIGSHREIIYKTFTFRIK